MNLPLALAILAAVFGPLGAYLVAARRLSGRIATSDAKDLWAESSAMRAEYRAQIAHMERTIEGLRTRLATVEDENMKLRERLRGAA